MTDAERSKSEPAEPDDRGPAARPAGEGSPASDRPVPDDEPLKAHGDALLDGLGSRHGQPPDDGTR